MSRRPLAVPALTRVLVLALLSLVSLAACTAAPTPQRRAPVAARPAPHPPAAAGAMTQTTVGVAY